MNNYEEKMGEFQQKLLENTKIEENIQKFRRDHKRLIKQIKTVDHKYQIRYIMDIQYKCIISIETMISLEREDSLIYHFLEDTIIYGSSQLQEMLRENLINNLNRFKCLCFYDDCAKIIKDRLTLSTNLKNVFYRIFLKKISNSLNLDIVYTQQLSSLIEHVRNENLEGLCRPIF